MSLIPVRWQQGVASVSSGQREAGDYTCRKPLRLGDHLLIFRPFADQRETIESFLQQAQPICGVARCRKRRANGADCGFFFFRSKSPEDCAVLDLARVVERLCEGGVRYRGCAIPLSRQCSKQIDATGNFDSGRPVGVKGAPSMATQNSGVLQFVASQVLGQRSQRGTSASAAT